jgi:hypothetical protein
MRLELVDAVRVLQATHASRLGGCDAVFEFVRSHALIGKPLGVSDVVAVPAQDLLHFAEECFGNENVAESTAPSQAL